MDRAPSRAKATNILRPASRAQELPAQARNNAPSPAMFGTGAQLPPQQQPPARVLAGGARVIGPSDSAQTAFAGGPSVGPGGLRRTPSAAQFTNRQQPPGSGRHRVSSYYDGMPMGDTSAMPRAASRSGSRADVGAAPMTPQQQFQQQFQQQQQQQFQQQPFQQQPFQQQQFPLSPLRGAWPGAAPGGMWTGQGGQVPMNTLFGSGFGTMGVGYGPASAGIAGNMSPVTPHHFPGQQPTPITGPGSRPGSSLQQAHPSRPATSTGFRSSGPESDGPVLVNVARGGARVIGPMRAKQAVADGPSFLNPIPQSPSSALEGVLPGAPHDAAAAAAAGRESIRSALSHISVDSGRSRSNSALLPIEESMEAAEARVSRKIQDLKITNESLLVVNAQLEGQVKSQSKLISDLKKQLQQKAPVSPDLALDSEISDEALRSAIKEDKAFERLISNLEHLIQDAKAALEFRSTVAAGKVISAAELNEDGSQLTVGAGPGQSTAAADGSGAALPQSGQGSCADSNSEGDESDAEAESRDGAEAADEARSESQQQQQRQEDEACDAHAQEARELVARLMVLALSSPDPAARERPLSRIPKQTGPAGAGAAGPARAQGALKTGLRTPAKAASARISNFGVASASTPVRSLTGSPTPSPKPSADSSKDPGSSAGEREQILEICRRLQQIL